MYTLYTVLLTYNGDDIPQDYKDRSVSATWRYNDYCMNHREHINRFCGKNARISVLNVASHMFSSRL
jgi:hypothetical protein